MCNLVNAHFKENWQTLRKLKGWKQFLSKGKKIRLQVQDADGGSGVVVGDLFAHNRILDTNGGLGLACMYNVHIKMLISGLDFMLR